MEIMISSKEEYKQKLEQYIAIGKELKEYDLAQHILSINSNTGNYGSKKRP